MLKILTVMIAMIAFVPSVNAATICGPYEKIVGTLNRKFAEKPVNRGVTNKGVMIEIYASFNGSFSVLMTDGNKLSCLLMAGNQWIKLIENIEGTDF